MIATAPHKKQPVTKPMVWDNLKSSFRKDIAPKSFLKRPFGIHRAFYPHFGKTYLQRLSLPPTLATLLHTVFPNEFEIFYKVLTNGVGTKELTRLKKGNKFQVVGPLGNGPDMRDIRDEGFEEIHVIGGGVGMAPLIFIVQALRYFSYKVVSFTGLEKLDMLRYSPDGLAGTFSVEPQEAALYIDDLKDAGIDRADIHVSITTSDTTSGSINQLIQEENLYEGVVSDQYGKYLQDMQRRKKILAFACGPMGMMKALAAITERYGIKLKVLMEKRMACGIGVCLSCVCETKNGEGNYSRVCIDGPIFDADEILW
jgi:dihydroorotate dehydrogenase electron transfer subunit